MQISLTLVFGQNLAIKDIETSDPYIKFKIGKNKYKTSIIKNTLDPIWNETFTGEVNVGDKIKFKCYDYDKLSKNDSMGHTKWIVPQLMNGVTESYLMENSLQGHIYFTVTCISGGIPQEDLKINPFDRTMIMKTQLVFFSPCDTLRDFIPGVLTKPKWYLEAKSESGVYRKDFSDCINTGIYKNYSTLRKNEFYFQGRVGEKIEFSLIGKKHPSDENEKVAIYKVYYLPDYYHHEKFSQLIRSGSEEGKFDFKFECVRSVYRSVDPEILPPLKVYDKPFDKEYPCQITFLSIQPYSELLKNKYPNSSEIVIENGDERIVYELFPDENRTYQNEERFLANTPFIMTWKYEQNFTIKFIQYSDKVNKKDEYEVIFETTQQWPSYVDKKSYSAFSFDVPEKNAKIKMVIKRPRRRISQFARDKIPYLKDIVEFDEHDREYLL